MRVTTLRDVERHIRSATLGHLQVSFDMHSVRRRVGEKPLFHGTLVSLGIVQRRVDVVRTAVHGLSALPLYPHKPREDCTTETSPALGS